MGTRETHLAVVDDDAAILDAVMVLLAESEWGVAIYSSGEAFLADLNRRVPDCVVLDPHLPGMNGADVMRALALEQLTVPVIGLTARPNSPVILDMRHSGVVQVLTKPITATALIDNISRVLPPS